MLSKMDTEIQRQEQTQNYQNFPDDSGMRKNEKNENEQLQIRFILQTYTILAVQLVLTFAISFATFNSKQVIQFQIDNEWLMITSICLMFFLQFVLYCCQSFAKSSPINLICLILFTLAITYIMTGLFQQFKNQSKDDPLIGLAFTILMILGFSFYAYKSNADYSQFSGILFFGIFLIIMVLQIWISQKNSMRILSIFSIIGCISSTQIVFGKGSCNKLSYEDQLIGALMLYIEFTRLYLANLIGHILSD